VRRALPVRLTASERRELTRWSRTATGRRATRARIVLAADRGGSHAAIASELGISVETAARWRERFLAMGINGLRREAPRAGAPHRVPRETVERVLTATVGRRAPGARAWSTRTLARVLRTNHMTVHRIWQAYGLSDRTTARSSTLKPATRADLVGVYRSPSASVVVFALHRAADPRRRRSGAQAPGAPSPDVDVRAASVRLSDALRSTSPGLRPLGRPPAGSLLVFLRDLETRVRAPARLEAIFDRPLELLGPRVGSWLGCHPRYRVFTTESPPEWTRSTEAWLLRWENASLDGESFRGIQAYHHLSGPAASERPAELPRIGWTAGADRP